MQVFSLACVWFICRSFFIFQLSFALIMSTGHQFNFRRQVFVDTKLQQGTGSLCCDLKGNRLSRLYHPQHSCGKEMFLHLSVILFTGGGVWQTPPPGRHTPGQTYPLGRHTPADGHCSGRYASYWNAFLFWVFYQMCTDRSNPTSLIESSKVKISNVLLMQTGLTLVCVEVAALWFWILFLLKILKIILEIALRKWVIKYNNLGLQFYCLMTLYAVKFVVLTILISCSHTW